MSSPERFVFLPDIHWGHEWKGRQKRPIHSLRCLDIVGQFLEDFKPTALIYGGDSLDCGAIAHHNREKRRSVEGLRIVEDAEAFAREVLLPFDKAASPRLRRFHVGNHCRFLEDVIEDYPGLEGIVDVRSILPLDAYDVVALGEFSRLGKLRFCHGDQLKGGQNHARATATTYGNYSVRYGHFHSFQAATRTDPLDATDVHTAVSIPCLCTRGPSYRRGEANAWINGFNWGYVHEDGSFNDYVTIIPSRGKVTINGKRYQP